MLDYLKGQLVAASLGKAIIEIGGIGITLEMPPEENSLNSKVGQEITLYTRLLIKEDSILLYGFKAAEERKLFNLILSVSGFGPRLALSLLSIFTVSQLYVAVLEENVMQLCRAHGVGRKAAQRLILELKEKLPKVISTEDLMVGQFSPAGKTALDDIVEALCALGYSPAEAATAVSKAAGQHQDATREELLKLALKSMAGG
jgi:Holliday junction DNA helicase RuvA